MHLSATLYDNSLLVDWLATQLRTKAFLNKSALDFPTLPGSIGGTIQVASLALLHFTVVASLELYATSVVFFRIHDLYCQLYSL